MKMSFFLTGLILVGCASSSPQIVTQRIVNDTTAVAIPQNASIFSDIPLKPMTASQSAARMN
jgi:uncharacterized protein YcfL